MIRIRCSASNTVALMKEAMKAPPGHRSTTPSKQGHKHAADNTPQKH
ncbi:hypothetical protein I6N98_04545 [Spongiibacter nanhainus]|uniref:Uncharacterized protein n=1 Tax=Spongiibacter nanhainus TaxID=2794344 RepID=A0A7T4R2N0_9GAMM|nr:hypothetical protein [Spongiibacter nanhainus]QQD19129.1 hypothetical protein I6N98_04545 [Spongiibacter nanhainus]